MTTTPLLTFSSLYPNAATPQHGIFVENRLTRLCQNHDVSARVIAPVPYFPFTHQIFGSYARFAQAPREAVRHGLPVRHPRYLSIPRIGWRKTPAFMAASSRICFADTLKHSGPGTIIDAHYAFPDGIAALKLARQHKRPLFVTARGTDLNLIPQDAQARQQLVRLAREATGLLAVCQALADIWLELGAPHDRVHVMRNGVDTALFRPDAGPGPEDVAHLPFPRLVSCGWLTARKGHDIAIKAFSRLQNSKGSLIIIGEGEERASLQALIDSLGLSSRVKLLGAKPPSLMPAYFAACDALILASSREGWANVLLEAMACGTPVVAARLWGTPEAVQAPEAGILVDTRTPEAFADALGRLLAAPPDRRATRDYAAQFSWDATTSALDDLFRETARRHG